MAAPSTQTEQDKLQRGSLTITDLGTTWTSPSINPIAAGYKGIGLQMTVVSTDAVGTLAVTASNDGTNFVNLPFQDSLTTTATTSAVSSSATTSVLREFYPVVFNEYKVVYTRTSGSTGTLNISWVGVR